MTFLSLHGEGTVTVEISVFQVSVIDSWLSRYGNKYIIQTIHLKPVQIHFFYSEKSCEAGPDFIFYLQTYL